MQQPPVPREGETAAPTAAVQPAATASQPAQTAAGKTALPVGFAARPGKTTALVQQPAHPEPPSAAASVGGTLFALALVLGLIFGLAWLARRMPGLAGMRGSAGLRVVAALPLGARERLLVVEVGDTQLLLASGAGGTRLLHTLETPLPPPAPAQTPAFAQLLAKQFGKQA